MVLPFRKKSLRFSAFTKNLKEIDRNEKNLSKNKIMTDTIVIGGSAGAFDCILSILKGLDKSIDTPIVIVLHRLKC
jgi:chemotaxis response regulator CheB